MSDMARQYLPIIICSASALTALVSAVLIDAAGASHLEMFEMTFSGMDKVTYFFVFGLMAYCCVVLLHESDLVDPLSSPVQTIVFVGIIGMLTEMIQSHSPGRTADIFDLFPDIAGATVFFLLWYYTQRHTKTR